MDILAPLFPVTRVTGRHAVSVYVQIRAVTVDALINALMR